MGKRRKNELEITAERTSTEGEIQGGTLTLTEAKKLFLREIRGLAKETQRWHRENVTALEKVLQRQDITVDDVNILNPRFVKDHFLYYMLEEMGLKVNTINGRMRSMRKLVQFLSEESYLRHDFSSDLPLLKQEKVIIPTFSKEQIQAILRQPVRKTFTGYRDYTLMLLLLETGIRVSELVSIRLSDIYMKDGQIRIHGKGAKQRLVPFQSQFRNVLRQYLQFRGSVPTDALFITVDDHAISKRYVQDLLQRYGEAAHIEDVRVSPHTFRHTMAKFYILAGGDIFSLQRILGHSSLETVRIYVELFSTDVQTQHKKFSFVENNFL